MEKNNYGYSYNDDKTVSRNILGTDICLVESAELEVTQDFR